MSGVRVLVGTRKGAFVLTSDGKRENWDVSGPHFGGWEIYHVRGSPADPDRLYASQSNGWFGQLIQRSDDGGKTWEPVGNEFQYDGVPGTHQWYDGTPHPWEFARVWHLEPSLTDPDTIFAGVEDAALFRSTDGGQSWNELSGLRGTARDLDGNRVRAECACTRSWSIRAIPSGSSWRSPPPASSARTTAARRGGRPTADCSSEDIPDPDAEVGHCVHRLAMHPSRPDVLFMQKHWDVMRSDDAGDSWHEVSGNLPTDFGFAIDVHAHEPETVYVVPIKSDSEHYPLDGKLRVYRSRTRRQRVGTAHEGPSAARLLRQRASRRDGGGLARSCGVYFGTTGGQVYASADAGDNWAPIVRDLPAVLSVEVQTIAMIRVVLPAHLRTLAHVERRGAGGGRGPPTQRAVLDALEARYPVLHGTIRDQVTQQRRAFVRFFACEEDLSHEPPDAPLPEAVATGAEPFFVVGAMAGADLVLRSLGASVRRLGPVCGLESGRLDEVGEHPPELDRVTVGEGVHLGAKIERQGQIVVARLHPEILVEHLLLERVRRSAGRPLLHRGHCATSSCTAGTAPRSPAE